MARSESPSAPIGGSVFDLTEEDDLRYDGAELFTGEMDALLERIAGLQAAGHPSLLVTLNVDIVLKMSRSPDFARIVADAETRILDGAPLVLLGRMLGAKEAHRNTGADLLPVSVRSAAQDGRMVVILGGAPGIAEKAAENLRDANPGAQIETVDFPWVDDVASPQLAGVAARLSQLQPSLVFICLGAPKQERWFNTWRAQLPAAVYIGAGAAVDFAAGVKSRAPRLMQRMGMEWAWRLGQEPRRLARRYLVEAPRFTVIAVRSLRRRRSARKDA